MREVLFITREDFIYKIGNDEAWISILIIGLVTILLLLTLTREKEETAKTELFSLDTNATLRGLSIICLLFGHLAYSRIDRIQPFEEGGYWAVIIFLFASGVGLTKTYGMANCGKVFIVKRVKRILFPTWITLILFYSLDFLLLKRGYSSTKIAANFAGILTPGPPNGPAWYISYILFCYLVMLGVSQIKIGSFRKGLLAFFVFYLVMSAISLCRKLENYFGVWTIYSVVFPSAAFLGLYHKSISRHLNLIYAYSRVGLVALAVGCMVLFYENCGIVEVMKSDLLPVVLKKYVYTLRPVYLIIVIMLTGYLIEKMKRASKVLEYLGEYSLEIFLLHYPFMAYYDFFLFRKPLWFFFLIYSVFILALSRVLRRAVIAMNTMVFDEYAEELVVGQM